MWNLCNEVHIIYIHTVIHFVQFYESLLNKASDKLLIVEKFQFTNNHEV